MTGVVECATGCRVRGQHTATCSGTCQGCRSSVERPHTQRCDGVAVNARDEANRRHVAMFGVAAPVVGLDGFRPACTGCLPRFAEGGSRLCGWCEQRFTSDVATAPTLVRHLRLMAHPTAGTKPASEVQSYSDPSEGSVLPRAAMDADDLHALLATVAAQWVDEHPGSQGPDETHVVRTRQTLRQIDGQTWVRRSEVAAIRDAAATAVLVAWLLPHLPWVTAQEWAGEVRRELGQLTAALRARWPVADLDERPVPGIECPRCQQVSLTYAPPAWFRAPFTVACQNPECGRPFSEDEWDRLVALHTARSPRAPHPYRED